MLHRHLYFSRVVSISHRYGLPLVRLLKFDPFGFCTRKLINNHIQNVVSLFSFGPLRSSRGLPLYFTPHCAAPFPSHFTGMLDLCHFYHTQRIENAFFVDLQATFIHWSLITNHESRRSSTFIIEVTSIFFLCRAHCLPIVGRLNDVFTISLLIFGEVSVELLPLPSHATIPIPLTIVMKGCPLLHCVDHCVSRRPRLFYFVLALFRKFTTWTRPPATAWLMSCISLSICDSWCPSHVICKTSTSCITSQDGPWRFRSIILVQIVSILDL